MPYLKRLPHPYHQIHRMKKHKYYLTMRGSAQLGTASRDEGEGFFLDLEQNGSIIMRLSLTGQKADMNSKEDPPGKETYQEDIAREVRRLIARVVRAFPCRESLEAVHDFTEDVSSGLIKTVITAREQLAKRVRNPERLNNPLLRGMRLVRDYYLMDVRDHIDDFVAARIPRWIKEVKTLPVYKGKLDAPHPALLTIDYDLLHGLCIYINQEIGFDRWKELAKELPQEASVPLSIPLSFWPKGEYVGVYIPDNATPEEAAYRILSDRKKLSPARLKKLVAECHKFYPGKVLDVIQQQWVKAYIDPKLNVIRTPLESEKEEIDVELPEPGESEKHGITVKDLF